MPPRPSLRLSRPCLSLKSLPRPTRTLPRLVIPSQPCLIKPVANRWFHTSHPCGQTPSPQGSTTSKLDDKTYERISERDMDRLHEGLENLCEEFGEEGWEVEYSSGVMNLHLPPHGIWVINKQPPNHQIWLSSPLSGPARFEWDPRDGAGGEGGGGVWKHARLGSTLGQVLEGELRGLVPRDGWEGCGIE